MIVRFVRLEGFVVCWRTADCPGLAGMRLSEEVCENIAGLTYLVKL
jgi:hypothetical protein